MVEVVAHDPGTLAFFCRKVVVRSGVPALPVDDPGFRRSATADRLD
ncbi:MAG TPA: hypothetical protein VEA61_08895 [Allosphingosinicella sp.]|nr:hypothetical protein [Allosphingosinicella sp.]